MVMKKLISLLPDQMKLMYFLFSNHLLATGDEGRTSDPDFRSPEMKLPKYTHLRV